MDGVKPYCMCRPEFTGEKCEILSPCLTENVCQNGGNCSASVKYNNTNSHYGRYNWVPIGFRNASCNCPPGFAGKKCELVNPCHDKSQNPCKNNGMYKNHCKN